MGLIKICLYFLVSGAPAVICANMIGASSTVALLLVVLIHELGHAIVWWLVGMRTFILVTPFLGFCMPLDLESDVLPFNAYGTTLLYLAGPFCNIVTLAIFAMASRIMPVLVTTEFVADLCIFSGILALINLLLPCPFLDGWRVLFYALAGPLFWTRSLLLGLCLLSIWMVWPVDRTLACSIGAVLVLLGAAVANSAMAERSCGPLRIQERVFMIAAWGMCVLMALGAICLHPYGLTMLRRLVFR